jgi:hypothetical protein
LNCGKLKDFRHYIEKLEPGPPTHGLSRKNQTFLTTKYIQNHKQWSLTTIDYKDSAICGFKG